MGFSLLLSKHVHISKFIFSNNFLARVLISSRPFSSKDDESNNPPDKSTSQSPEKQPKEASEKTEKMSEFSEQNAKAADAAKESAKIKITNLLSNIEVSSDVPVKTTSKLDLAKPLKRISKKERFEIMKENESTPEKELNLAVKKVASSFKDAEKIESELSEKLNTLNLSKDANKENAVIDESQFDNNVSETLVSSVADVAETISETPIPPRTELNEKLVKMSVEKKSVPEQRRPVYYNDAPAPRQRQRRGGQMSVMAQLRQEEQLEASAQKWASYVEQRSGRKSYKDDRYPRYRPRRNMEMSVIEQMRQEARFAASAKKDYYTEQEKQYKEEFKPRHREHQSGEKFKPRYSGQSGEEFKPRYREHQSGEEFKPRHREHQSGENFKPRHRDFQSGEEFKPGHREYQTGEEFKPRHREHQSGEMSVIGRMRLEALSATFNKRDSIDEIKPMSRPQIRKIDLFGSTPLNIFQLDSETKPEPGNVFWQKLQDKQLRLLFQFAPANGFEEMIMWTEQGKHWKFPIDNETEMGAEEKIGFNEHVFLEHHLKGFPTRGPIRHFMELVCVGLSKNPYITVERKIENIDWFRDYFKDKESILKETGALV